MPVVIENWAGTVFDPQLPLDLNATQAAIVAQLKASGDVLARVEISGFPDRPDDYRLTHPIGAVLVLYEGSQFTQDPTTIDEVRQERTMIWSITTVTRDLGWAYGGPPSASNPGAYALLERIRYAIAGFQVNQGYTKFVPLTQKFIKKDKDGGAWYYESRFKHRTTVINVVPEVDYATLHDVQYTRVEQPGIIYTFDGGGTTQLPRTNVRDLRVLNPSMSVTYTLNTDYTVDGPSGVVTAIGALGPGSQVKIGFAYIEAEVSDS